MLLALILDFGSCRTAPFEHCAPKPDSPDAHHTYPGPVIATVLVIAPLRPLRGPRPTLMYWSGTALELPSPGMPRVVGRIAHGRQP